MSTQRIEKETHTNKTTRPCCPKYWNTVYCINLKCPSSLENKLCVRVYMLLVFYHYTHLDPEYRYIRTHHEAQNTDINGIPATWAGGGGGGGVNQLVFITSAERKYRHVYPVRLIKYRHVYTMRLIKYRHVYAMRLIKYRHVYAMRLIKYRHVYAVRLIKYRHVYPMRLIKYRHVYAVRLIKYRQTCDKIHVYTMRLIKYRHVYTMRLIKYRHVYAMRLIKYRHVYQ